MSELALKKTLTYRYVIYGVLAVAYFFVYFHRTSPAVMAPEILKDFHVEPAALGLLSSMYFYAYALGQLPAGILADKWGARKTVAVFLLIAGLGGLIFGLTKSFTGLIMGRFIVGLGVGFVYVPAMRVLTDWFRKNEFATYSGLLLAIGNMGSLMAAAPLVLLMTGIGWRNSMLSVGLITIVLAVLAYVLIRNKPADLGGAPLEMLEEQRAQDMRQDTISIGAGLRRIISNRNFLTIAAISFAFYGTIMGFQGLWGGPYLQSVYGMSKTQAGSVLMMIPAGMILGCPLAGYLSDKLFKSRKKVLLYGCFLHTLAWVPLLFMLEAMPVKVLMALMFYYGLTGGSFVLCFANTKEACGSALAGTAIGAVNLFLFGGGAFFQQVMGMIIGSSPQVSSGVYPPEAFRMSFGLCAVSLVLGMFIYTFHQEKPLG